MRAVRWLPLTFALAVAVALVPAAQGATHLIVVLTSLNTIQQVHDNPPMGKGNKGDSIDFKDLLVTTKAALGHKKNHKIAWDAGTVIYVTGSVQKILVRVTFPGLGTITYEGVLKSLKGGNSSVPIVAGTGQFKGARGTVIIGPGDVKSLNTFDLTVPGRIVLPTSPVA
jgi:hypothetical protein